MSARSNSWPLETRIAPAALAASKVMFWLQAIRFIPKALPIRATCDPIRPSPASDGSAYREYALTPKGRELFPVIVALRQWGESYLFSRGEKRLQVLDKRTGKPFRVQVHNAIGEILTANHLELVTVKN